MQIAGAAAGGEKARGEGGLVQEKVAEAFGVWLEPEPVIV